MNHLKNNVNYKSSIKNTLSKKHVLIAISIVILLTITACLTLTILVKKDIEVNKNSTAKITTQNTDLGENSKSISTTDTKSNDKEVLSKMTKKDITLKPVYLFNKKLPFYRQVNIKESSILSFMSTLEVFYSISILLIFAIIIVTLIVALLYKPATKLFAYLNIKKVFRKNNTQNTLNKKAL